MNKTIALHLNFQSFLANVNEWNIHHNYRHLRYEGGHIHQHTRRSHGMGISLSLSHEERVRSNGFFSNTMSFQENVAEFKCEPVSPFYIPELKIVNSGLIYEGKPVDVILENVRSRYVVGEDDFVLRLETHELKLVVANVKHPLPLREEPN